MVWAQSHEINVGVRLQKSLHLYWENGFTLHYAHTGVLRGDLHAGLTYATSRWGSAWHSNAIRQDQYLLSGTYYFRHEKRWQPFIRANTGYFWADMEEAIFEVLPHQSLLLSAEGGIRFRFRTPLRVAPSLGYNFITGDGISGPGTLYPVFYQITMTYAFAF